MSESTIKKYQMWIDGQPRDSESGETMESINPYTADAWARFPLGAEDDVNSAVEAADRAFRDSWWRHDPRRRAKALARLADLLEKNAERLALVESSDIGKTITESRISNLLAPSHYRYAASLAEASIAGEVTVGEATNMVNYAIREPYGVISVQVPWNTPLAVMGQGCAPALAAGNTLVVKPSETAPCSVLEFGPLTAEAGIPDGVVNIVSGLGPVVGALMTSHSKVRKVLFTGGAPAGRLVAAEAGRRLVPVTLELGGKSPNIVFNDADLDKAVAGLVWGYAGGAGQSCAAGSRLLIEESIAGELIERLVNMSENLKLGDPADAATDIGPLCSQSQFDRVTSMVAEALADGAEALCGGRPFDAGSGSPSLFYAPTVLSGVSRNAKIAQEEVFGPVTCVFTFRDEAEAIEIANDTPYGLAAGLWTQDIDRAHRVVPNLAAGVVWVNNYKGGDPGFAFGGCRESGYGRENGREGLREFQQIKSVNVMLG